MELMDRAEEEYDLNMLAELKYGYLPNYTKNGLPWILLIDINYQSYCRLNCKSRWVGPKSKQHTQDLQLLRVALEVFVLQKIVIQ